MNTTNIKIDVQKAIEQLKIEMKHPIAIDENYADFIITDGCAENYAKRAVRSLFEKNPLWMDDMLIAEFVLSESPLSLEYFSKRIKNNYKMVLHAIHHNPKAFNFASKYLKQEYFLIKTVLEKDPYWYVNLPDNLKMERTFVEIFLKKSENYSTCIPAVPCDFYHKVKNKDIVEYILNKNGLYLVYFSNKIQDNLDFVKLAIKFNAQALKYASKRLKDNPSVAKLAINNDIWAYQYLSKRLKMSRGFIKTVLRKDGMFLENFEYSKFKINDVNIAYDDREFVEVAIKSNANAIQYASEKLRNDLSINKLALEKSPDAIHCLTEESLYNSNLLATIFKTTLADNFSNYFADKWIKQFPDKVFKNELYSCLKKEPQILFLETFEAMNKHKFWSDNSLKHDLKRNRLYLDVMFDCCTKETIIKMIQNNCMDCMKKPLADTINKKEIFEMNMAKKITKKDRKLSF